MTGELRIGISGWLYPRWRKVFYPPGLPQREELAYASRAFDTVEINGTFYSLQRPESFKRWRAETPDEFQFAIKGSRFITHMKKLRDVEAALSNFFAQGVLVLGEKLGPVLWQLPEQLTFDEGRIRDFLAALPRTTGAAARLARKHDARLEGRAFTRAVVAKPLRHALEVRHESYRTRAFFRLLEEHQVAQVVSDSAGRFPRFEEVTTDLVYARLHGDTELYTSGYSSEALGRWATRIRKWRRGGASVFVYFDNDAKVHAPFDAQALVGRLTP